MGRTPTIAAGERKPAGSPCPPQPRNARPDAPMAAVPIPFRRVYTAGQVARYVGVAPRTVSKWIDAGLLAGYRLPKGDGGPGDRRVPAAALAAFFAAKLPRYRVADVSPPLALVGVGGFVTACGLAASDLGVEVAMLDPGKWPDRGEAEAAVAKTGGPPDWPHPGRAVIDLNTAARSNVAALRRRCPHAAIAVVEPDDGMTEAQARKLGADVLIRHPATPQKVIDFLTDRQPK